MNPTQIFAKIINDYKPFATAVINGNSQNPALNGLVSFYETPYYGLLVVADIYGLP